MYKRQIKSRIKSMDGIFKKAKKKNIPITMEGIEEGIRDIAGVRVISVSYTHLDVYKRQSRDLLQKSLRRYQKRSRILLG